MAFRFRTRLSFTISTLLFLTVAALCIVSIGVHVYDLSSLGYSRGRDLHILASRNIEFGVNVPDEVMRVVDEQMVVQALLVSELVALAEKNGAASSTEVEAALNRVIDRSQAYAGEPLVDSFRIIDKEGNVREQAGAEPIVHVPVDPAESFEQLLEPDAQPIVREIPLEGADGAEFKYVGVSGADEPRIVQVGASQEILQTIQEQFDLDDLLTRFMLPEHFHRVAVVDESGRVLAAVDAEERRGEGVIDERMIQECRNYLRRNTGEPGFVQSGRALWVITDIDNPRDDSRYALFIEHELADDMQYVVDRVALVLTAGLVMVLVGSLVGLFLSRSLSKPIVALSKGAEEFGKGNLSYRLYFKRKDEFQGLAQAFNTMAISLQEYMHELEQETSHRERLESEFRIAADMQKALLPENPPEVTGLQLAGWSQPSREVGGDFYDFFKMKDGKIGIALGDATGKGVSAALLTTECAGILATLAQEHSEPDDLLARTNAALHARIGDTHRFVTLFLIVYDPETGAIRYATAGHPSPVLLNEETGEARWLGEEMRGYPLGIMENVRYEFDEYSLKPGDTLVIFSDGLPDAQNPDGAMYGEDRVLEYLNTVRGASIEALLDRLRSDATAHMRGKEPIDDMTLVAVRFTGVLAGAAVRA